MRFIRGGGLFDISASHHLQNTPLPSPCSIPVRQIRVASTSPPQKVANAIAFDLSHYGAAEVAASQPPALAVMAKALVLARGELLRRGFELGALPSLARAPGRKPGKPVSGGGGEMLGKTQQAGGKEEQAVMAEVLVLPWGNCSGGV